MRAVARPGFAPAPRIVMRSGREGLVRLETRRSRVTGPNLPGETRSAFLKVPLREVRAWPITCQLESLGRQRWIVTAWRPFALLGRRPLTATRPPAGTERRESQALIRPAFSSSPTLSRTITT